MPVQVFCDGGRYLASESPSIKFDGTESGLVNGLQTKQHGETRDCPEPCVGHAITTVPGNPKDALNPLLIEQTRGTLVR